MLQGPKGQPSVAAALFGVQCVLPLAAGFTSSANPSATTYSCDARTLPETRVWGSKPENVHWKNISQFGSFPCRRVIASDFQHSCIPRNFKIPEVTSGLSHARKQSRVIESTLIYGQ